jgi:hypothetical protein
MFIFVSCLQDLYLEHQVDVVVSNEDNHGRTEPIGDDAGGMGASSVETFTSNPIGSSVAEIPRPSTTDQTTATAPSGGRQKKKRVMLSTKHKQDKPPVGQVIIELAPYRGPRSPLDLVAVEHIFERLFKAFQHVSQSARIGTSAGDDAPSSKRARALSLKRMIVPK